MFLRKILPLKLGKAKRSNTIVPDKKVDDEIHDVSPEIDGFMVKEPGPCNSAKYCIVTWEKNRSTLYLYEYPNPYSTSVKKGKLLLAARKFKHPSHIEYVMSLDPNDFSKDSDSYVGKLSSDYLGINFTIYQKGLPSDDAIATKQTSPVLAKNFKVGQICYEFNELKSQGQRNFVHSIRCPSKFDCRKNRALRNVTPKWHDDLQCLCLEFNSRVNYSKDFDKWQKLGKEEEEKILFSSWLVGDTTAILIYRYPLSALQTLARYISGFRIYYNNTFSA